MTQVKIKRVYEVEDKSDGFRVLVDKLWPRGIKKENLHYDLWAKNIAPSTPLRKWYHDDMTNHWSDFKKRYIQELEVSPAVKAFIEQIRDQKMVTLIYASKNAIENHALVLKEYLERELK